MNNSYSILMTIYTKDDPSYVRRAIDSMLNQTVKTDDYVVVCDGTLTNELNEVINSFISSNDCFNVVRLEKNVGLGAALAIGLEHCKNDLVARMDDDDISVDCRCEKELEEFKKNPSLDICGSYMNEFIDDIDGELRLKTVPLTNSEILLFSRRRNPFNHSTVMFKKESILRAGNYKPMRVNQDVELWVRSLHNGLIGANIPEPLVYFRFDVNTYKRRKEKNNVKLMIQTWKSFYKLGYCGYSDYLNVKFKQRMVRLMPLWLIKWCYNHLR